MKLKEYLAKYKLTKAEVARRCGIPYSVFFYACEGYGVQYKTMIKILNECDGVTLEDLRPTKKAKVSKRSKIKKDLIS